MIFNVENFSASVDPLESVRSITIDMSISVWSSSIREKNGNLMHSFWRVLPETESGVCVTDVSCWASFLGVNEIWEFNWISDEEDWGIVSDDIVVTFFSVEFDSKSSWISNCIWSSSFTSDGRESKEDWSFLSYCV